MSTSPSNVNKSNEEVCEYLHAVGRSLRGRAGQAVAIMVACPEFEAHPRTERKTKKAEGAKEKEGEEEDILQGQRLPTISKGSVRTEIDDWRTSGDSESESIDEVDYSGKSYSPGSDTDKKDRRKANEDKLSVEDREEIYRERGIDEKVPMKALPFEDTSDDESFSKREENKPGASTKKKEVINQNYDRTAGWSEYFSTKKDPLSSVGCAL
ncbi:hypothetical protein Aperf_G00000096350 [Anoplocephala perfoliata]